jgi:dienelactone hydrolase
VTAQEATSKRVSYSTPQSKYLDTVATVAGTLSIPGGKAAGVPAVLILHASGGVDGTGAPYAAALNKAGIATYEIEMFGPGQTLQSHPTVQQNMPHVFGALTFLAAQPEIDPNRIGVMGFSWGGMVAIVAATERFTNDFTQGKLKFRAHLALYPVCWIHSSVLDGSAESSPHKFMRLDRAAYSRFTGAPVYILAGAKDDYDDPDSCAKFVSEANAATASTTFAQTTYPRAYHGWDKPKDVQSKSPLAHKGRGGPWAGYADRGIAEQSRKFAVEFFTKQLAAP